MTRSCINNVNPGPVLVSVALACAGMLAVMTSAFPQAAMPRPEKTCDVAGLKWNDDPVFRSTLHHTDRERGIAQIACAVEDISDIQVGDIRLRLMRSILFDGRVGDVRLTSALVTVATLEGESQSTVGRLFLGPDPLDGQMRFSPQAVRIDGGILIRLSPLHRSLYRLEKGVLTSLPAFDWRSSIDDAFPGKARSGEILSLDIERMEARIAVRADATDPAQRLASAYEPSRMVVASLEWRDRRIVTRSTRIEDRKMDDNAFLDQMSELDETIRSGLKDLPAGVEPCSLGAWSNDTDPRGLNVRAAPDARAKVLGIVPPPRKMPKDQESFGPEPVKAEFRIIGFKDGWFLIEKIEAPGVRYDVSYPAHLPKPFKGRGWINARLAGAAYANGGLPDGRLYLSPHADAGFIEAHDASGVPVTADGSPKRILACSGWWGLIETSEGQRGWKRTLCSNQVTNCS